MSTVYVHCTLTLFDCIIVFSVSLPAVLLPAVSLRAVSMPQFYCLKSHCPQSHCPQSHCPQSHCLKSHCLKSHCPQFHCPKYHWPQSYCPKYCTSYLPKTTLCKPLPISSSHSFPISLNIFLFHHSTISFFHCRLPHCLTFWMSHSLAIFFTNNCMQSQSVSLYYGKPTLAAIPNECFLGNRQNHKELLLDYYIQIWLEACSATVWVKKA